ncbi:hypothetical protein AAVH_03444 [Aphelenchoides avenae]|nr:hypothetical protein AAVH_03444 [Aphelenchus avenae]
MASRNNAANRFAADDGEEDAPHSPFRGRDYPQADDMHFDMGFSMSKMDKPLDIAADKLVHKDFYNDFGDLFNPDAE